MTFNISHAVREFMEACAQRVRTEPDLTVVQEGERALRYHLLREEFEEYTEAEFDHTVAWPNEAGANPPLRADDNALVAIADALADMVYVIYGTAHAYGIPLDDVLAEVHASNMSKVGPDGFVEKDENGKVVKPATFFPPDIRKVLA